MSHESLLLELAARITAAPDEQQTAEATLTWLGAVWALFDAGVISADERQGFYGGLHRRRHPNMPKRSGDPRAFERMERARRRGAEALKEYERHPERLPPVGPWRPEWVLFPEPAGTDPELLLVEGFEQRVIVHLRIGADESQRWLARIPPTGQREPPGSAQDDLGTEYRVSPGGQSGRLVFVTVGPAPPPAARRLDIRVGESEWSLDLRRDRVDAETLHREPTYLDAPQLCSGVSGSRGLRAAELRLALNPKWLTIGSGTAYLGGARRALFDAGLLADESDANEPSPGASELPGGGLLPFTRAAYFRPPQTVGVRLIAAFGSDCGVMLRWAQLPRVYGPGLPERWVIERHTEVRLADDAGSPYVAAVQESGAGGFWEPPDFHGNTLSVTDRRLGGSVFEAAIGDGAAQFSFD